MRRFGLGMGISMHDRVGRIASIGCWLVAAFAGIAAPAADITAGKEKAEMCIACHGEGGISQIEKMPSLAGQPDQFIQWQLVFFRAGTRKNEQMQPVVEQLSNEDIRNLGAYFATLTPPKAQAGRKSGSVGRARRPPRAGVAPRAIPTITPAARRSPRRRPARGLSGQGAARLQVRRASRRRHGGDGGSRVFAQRRGNRGAGALSRAS